MSQAGQSPSSTEVRHRWNDPQTLYLLELLLRACRNGQLTSSKVGPLQHVFEGFIPSLSRRFPHQQWTVKTVTHRYKWCRSVWRAFRAAEERPGTRYREDNGWLSMTRQTASYINKTYGRFGRVVTTKPLVISDTITRDVWAEIFIEPGHCSAIEAQDTAGFAAAAAKAARERAGIWKEESLLNDFGTDCGTPTSGGESVQPAPTPGVQGGNLSIQPARQVARRDIPADASRGEDDEEFVENMIIDNHVEQVAMSAMLHKKFPKKHVIVQQAVGADELARAIRDVQCQGFEMKQEIKVIVWLAKNPIHPVVWNAFSSKEIKQAWAERPLY
ncbi:hypothetical protein E4U41_005802 [Claviceps citrina]|nr:hypothetical protein E4U41_005802 [Claviceps citrina]